jgi:DNA-binding LacI/PurR family transcriptional regulator
MSEIKNRKITIRDVADLADVAPSTVSRVLHNNTRISPQTRIKVLEAMDKLGYHPNAAAQSLARRRSSSLGLILPNNKDELFMNPFFVMVMRGFSIYAQDAGYNLMYTFSKDEDIELQFIKDYSQGLVIDGILLFTTRIDDKCIHYLQQSNFPFVVIGRPEDTTQVYWVDNDNFQAVYNAVNHLMNQGHKKIAFISAPLNFNYTRVRQQGYIQAITNRGFERNEYLISEGDDNTEKTGYECMKKILQKETPDAVIATDDLLAIGAMQFLKEKRLNCAVIGFNNTLKGRYENPSLSTIDVNAEKIGEHAARLLIEVVEKKEPKINHVIVPADFIERESTLSRVI